MFDMVDFDHYEDQEVFRMEDEYRVKGLNRDQVKDRERGRMILNGNQLKTVIVPLLGKKAREAKKGKK